MKNKLNMSWLKNSEKNRKAMTNPIQGFEFRNAPKIKEESVNVKVFFYLIWWIPCTPKGK